MRKSHSILAALALSLPLLAGATIAAGSGPTTDRSGKAAAGAAPALRPFSVPDSIELSSIVDPASADELPRRIAPLFSPDRRTFLLITERGKVATDQTESTIWLFDRQAVTAYVRHRSAARPAPRPLATLAATSNMPVISAVRWLGDSARISFLGKDGSPYQRLYIADVRTGQVTAVTPAGAFVSAYEISGDTIAYTTVIVPPRAAPGDEMVAVAGRSLWSLLYPEPLDLADVEVDSIGSYAVALHVQQGGKELPLALSLRGKPLKLFPSAWSLAPPLAVAPDGTSLITLAPVPEIPAGWDAYPPQPTIGSPRLVPGDPLAVAEENFYKPLWFVRIDLRTGEASPLLDAPAARSLGYLAPTRAIWLADSRRALLCNTFLPLAGGPLAGGRAPAGKSGEPRAAAGPVIALVDVKTGEVQASQALTLPTLHDAKRIYIGDVAWDDADQEMTLSYTVPPPAEPSAAPPAEIFSLRGSRWIRLGPRGKAPAGAAGKHAGGDAVELSIDESYDRPPTLAGRRRGAGGAGAAATPAIVVWDPNPQLASLALGKVSVFHWQDKEGAPWAGLLALPPDHDPGRRYPLVIQTHGYRLDRFFAEGTFTTGSGGRALAARGIVVLQMDMPSTYLYTAADAPFQLRGFQAAVARLAADGLIDPRRVGVIGFSYTCYHTLYALTNDPRLFAAAAITDGFNMGYFQYVIDDGPSQDIMEEVNGGKPWGAGLASWIARSPELNLEKVTSPLLVSALGRGSLLSMWEPYAGLYRMGKPVDMLWMRRENVTHVLLRPMHRRLSQQAAVDWFDFWLNGHENPDPADPAKAEQYARWRELRKAQQGAAAGAAGEHRRPPAGSLIEDSPSPRSDACERDPGLLAHRLAGGRRARLVLRADVDGDQEAVGALVLERLGAHPVGFHLVRHHYEAVVVRGSPVGEVLEHHRARTVRRGGAHQPHLGRLAAVHGGVGGLVVVLPGVDDGFRGAVGVPGDREEVTDDVLDAGALGGSQGLVEVEHVPIHVTLREVSAQVVDQPELGSGQRGRAVVALVDPVGKVGAAVVGLLAAVIVMACRLGVEVALAEHRATARLDGRAVHLPVGGRLGRGSCRRCGGGPATEGHDRRDGDQGGHGCHSSHQHLLTHRMGHC